MTPLFTIREVNDATFPHHAMSGRLDELLRSPGSQPVRCVATAPGHVVVSVAGGKYLHAFSARTPHPSRRTKSAEGPSAAEKTASPERDAFVESKTRLSPDLEPERLETSALLSFHGASPVSRVVFVPAGAAGNEKTPLALLAVQEDGGVAAWRWVEEESGETNVRNDKTKNDDRRGAHWCACAPLYHAGGPPLVLEPGSGLFDSRRGSVADAALVTTLNIRDGRQRVKLACLTSGTSSSREEDEEGPRVSTPWLVLLDVGFLDDLLRVDDGAKKSGDPEALAPVPRASAVLSAGGDEFWVVAEGGGAANGRVATRWAFSHTGRTRATRRVDLSAAAATADAAAAAADGAERAVAAGRTLGRLAACLHYPSRELLVVTDRGNVLCLSPGLRGFDSGTDEARDASASASAAESEKKTLGAASEKEKHSVRHVGYLRGFADDFAAAAKSWHVSNSLVAHGPFLYLAWFFLKSAETKREDGRVIRAARHREPPETDDVRYAEEEEDDALAHRASSVSAYHLSSGVSLGTVQIPPLPPLAGSISTTRRAIGKDDDEMTHPHTRTLSAATRCAHGAHTRLVDGGAGGAFLFATDAENRAAVVFVVAAAAASATLARVYVGDASELTNQTHRRVNSAIQFRERAHSKMSCLRSARRECAWFGGSLERLDASAALAIAELDVDLRARGTPRLSHRSNLVSDDADNEGKNERTTNITEETTLDDVLLSPTRARVAEPALVLRAQKKNDAWRVVADEMRAFFRKNHPPVSSTDGASVSPLSDADAARAFAVFSELGAAEARDVHGALAAGGAAGAEDDAEAKILNRDLRLTESETNRANAGDSRFLRAGLAALDAAVKAAAPWGSENKEDGEKEKIAVFEAEGRDALRAVARHARRLGSVSTETANSAFSDDKRSTLDDFRDVCFFLSSNGNSSDGELLSSEAPPASSLEAAAALLAVTPTVAASASAESDIASDERDAFASACVCAHAYRPRLVLWLVARAAARAAKAGAFADTRAAARVLATRALAAAPPVPETHAHAAVAEARASLLSLAGHEHAATWLLLTWGSHAAEDGARRETDDAVSDVSVDEREEKERRLFARTSSFGWGSAARLLSFGGGTFSSADLAAGGEVFETLASALRHVARRALRRENRERSHSESSDKIAPSVRVEEADPATAAAHTLRAAQTLAEAMEGRPLAGRRSSCDPRDPQVGSFEPGTDALERLVAAAAARLAGLTDAIEKNARASP